jgi:putative ABC transport system permease protein
MLGENVLLAPSAAITEWLSPQVEWLVDAPAPVTWDDVGRLNRSGLVVVSRAVLLDPPTDPVEALRDVVGSPREFAVGSLIAGLALLEVVLLAGPAFAVSARRRQRQLALVAANGGTPAHVRRIVLADGVVLGVIGAGVGVALAIPAAFLARPLLEEGLVGARGGAYRVFPLALLGIGALAVATGLLAALVPAFVTARQNVVSALAGRRGVIRSRKRWLVLGLGLVAVAVGLVAVGAVTIEENSMLAGLVVGEVGLVMCTPALVGLIGRLGRVLPLAPRIALRDTARNRAAAAPAISAVMAAVAGSVAIGLYLDSSANRYGAWADDAIPTGFARFYLDPGGPDRPPAPRAAAERAIRVSLPVAEFRTVRSVGCQSPAPEQPTRDRFPADDAEPQGVCQFVPIMVPDRVCPYDEIYRTGARQLTAEEMRAARRDPRCAGDPFGAHREINVDDGVGVAALTGAGPDDAAAAAAMLRAGGVAVQDGRYVADGRITLGVVEEREADYFVDTPPIRRRITVPAHVLTTATGGPLVIVPPSLVADEKFAAVPDAIVAATTRMPTAAEVERFEAGLQALGIDGYVNLGRTERAEPTPLIVAGIAALITLGAVAIATGLAAAEGRADLSTLAAVGASPRLRRGLSLSQSGVIAGLGSGLGAVAGLGAATAVLVALNQRYEAVWPAPAPFPLTPPWLSLAVALVVVPLIALAGAGLLTRSRLPIERRT